MAKTKELTTQDGKRDGRSITSAENGKKGGRPEGSVSEETRLKLEMRKRLIERVHEDYDELLGACINLAKGVLAAKETPDGELVFYTTKPHKEMLGYLLDQTVGKATQVIEVEDKRTISMERMMELHELAEAEISKQQTYVKRKKVKTKNTKEASPKGKTRTTTVI